MSQDKERQARIDALERRNAEMLARTKEQGLRVKPTHLDKVPAGSPSFSHGRNRKI